MYSAHAPAPRRLATASPGSLATTHSAAFTRTDAVAILAGLTLMVALALPALANSRARSLRLACLNNLRLVGQGMSAWGVDHGDLAPWQVPWIEGGTRPSGPGQLPSPSPVGPPIPGWLVGGLNLNAYFQWAWMSNELRTPKILACPADEQKTPATRWDTGADAGFLNTRFQNKAVSYLASAHPVPPLGRDIVAGDRNLRFDGFTQSCSVGLSGLGVINLRPLPALRIPTIEPGIHNEEGNFLFTDGRVEELSNFGLRTTLSGFNLDAASSHYLVP